jgi:hypothetical protein
MSNSTETATLRKHLLDAGFAVVQLTFAIALGYAILGHGLLSPGVPRAKAQSPRLMVASVATTGPDVHAAPASPVAEPDAATAPAPSEPMPVVPAPVEAPAPSGITWPQTVTGRVLDGHRQPVAGASIVAGGKEVRTDAEGTFSLQPPAAAPLLVKMPGFDKVSVAPTQGPVEVVLKPRVIKAAYMTYYGFGDRGIRNRVLDMVARTELNAVVIDVKGDRGWIIYRTEVSLALQVGAQGPATLKNFDAMLADLKARGIYTIARIVTFKDNILANSRPDLAIIDTRTGKPWVDREKLAWVDPFREEVWNYNIEIAKEAIRKGFDEVQFDYVRFPTDGKLGAARYSRPNNRDTRLPTVAAFLERARRQLGPTGAFVAADVFGYTAFNENDTDIGQRIEELAPHVDYLCPMVYPSGYHVGIPGYRNPVANSYHVVHDSVRLIRKRSGHAVARVRPWLQDFRDYAFDRRIFGVAEIRDQIRGADEAGAIGWMLWNPRNSYTNGALRGKGALAAQ